MKKKTQKIDLTGKQLSYLRRYGEAGEHGIHNEKFWSEAIRELIQGGYVESIERRVTIQAIRITAKGLNALGKVAP